MKKLLILITFLNISIFCKAQIYKVLEPLKTDDTNKVSDSSYSFENWFDLQKSNIQELDLLSSKDDESNRHYAIKIVRPDLNQYPILALPIDTTVYKMPNLFEVKMNGKQPN